MSSPAHQAVFLSYASQDADAAQRVCAALRAAGVEVWFDQNELTGGDAWDQKIRKQIKECALFVPVISANTNARVEGYFRLEWKLADDRTHLMARGTPFLVPICIDDTKDSDALVPDSFLNVQWTRLPGGETPPKFAERVAHLRGDGTTPPTVRTTRSTPVSDLSAAPAPAAPTARRARWPIVLGACVIISLGLYLSLRPPPGGPAVATTATALPGLAADPDLKRAQQLLEAADAIPADVALAEELCRTVLKQRPTDPAASVMMARVQAYTLLRGFDRSEVRYAQAKQAAERALALSPDDTEALAAMGTYLYSRRVELPRAAKLIRQAIAARPDDVRHYRMLDEILRSDSNVPASESLASSQRTADTFPTDALAQYGLARHFRDLAMLEPAERYLDLAIKLGPVANAIIAKARLALAVRGDTAEMKALLDQLPERYRTTDRAVFGNVAYAFASGRYEEGIESLRGTPEPWLIDFEYTGPKALLEGELLLLQGKAERARLSFESALAELAKHTAVTTVSFRSMWLNAWLLARLGRGEEARTRNAVIFPEYPRPFRMFLGQNWWFNPIVINLILGERAKALDLMREAVEFQNGRDILRVGLKVDPRMAPFREDPEIKALLAAQASTKSARIAVSTRDWPKNPALKRAVAMIDGLDTIRDDFALAEEVARRELERAPADPEAVTVMARIQSHYLLRGFDRRDSRIALAGQFSERAVQLAPEEPEALFALSNYLGVRNLEPARAAALINKACDLEPGQPRYWRLAALNVNDVAGGIAMAEENVRRFPADALTHYDLSIRYRDAGRWADFEREIDATLALAPVANAIVWKARAMLGLHGDPAGMKTWLDKVPARISGQERTVFSRFLYAALSGDYDYGFAALRSYTESWFLDVAEYGGPSALLHATLLELQGKSALARIQFEVSLAEVQRQKLAMPTDLWVRRAEIWTLRGLGRLEEARALNRTYAEMLARPIQFTPVAGWFFGPAALSLLLDDRALALTLLREGTAAPLGREALRGHLRTDPRMKSVRDEMEIAALAGPVDAKK